MESVVSGDSNPSGLGGINVNDHTVAKQRCRTGLEVVIYDWLNGPGAVRCCKEKSCKHHRQPGGVQVQFSSRSGISVEATQTEEKE